MTEGATGREGGERACETREGKGTWVPLSSLALSRFTRSLPLAPSRSDPRALGGVAASCHDLCRDTFSSSRLAPLYYLYSVLRLQTIKSATLSNEVMTYVMTYVRRS